LSLATILSDKEDQASSYKEKEEEELSPPPSPTITVTISAATDDLSVLAKCDYVTGLNDLTGDLTSQFKRQLDI